MIRKFIVINGMDVFIINRISMSEAVDYAVNVCNCSNEIIVREINNHYHIKKLETI